MAKYALHRLMHTIPTLLVIITLAFFLIRLAPGGPFDSDRRLHPEVEANLNAKYHLDEPLVQQYGRYMWDILRGDFGPSFQYRDFSVNELIYDSFSVSLKLGIAAICLAILFGVSMGIIAALRQNSITDYSVMTVAMTGISIPNFVLAPLFVLFFAIYLDWLPAGGWERGTIADMILPITSLALPQVAYIARLTRGSLIEVLRSNYIRTAKAKGLPTSKIILRHALKPMLLPIVSYLGPATAAVITGSVVIEQIFSVPGLGTHFVTGALNRDYTLVMGVVVFYGTLIILFNFIVDLFYALLDPKVRYS